jgi:aspartate aminotransferase
MLVCQSFAKNAGLYGERVGALHIVGVNKAAADRIRSQLSVLQRSEISNPPSNGARIVGQQMDILQITEIQKIDGSHYAR